jgi:hypothetical protein
VDKEDLRTEIAFFLKAKRVYSESRCVLMNSIQQITFNVLLKFLSPLTMMVSMRLKIWQKLYGWEYTFSIEPKHIHDDNN